ncbi:MAG: Ribbon-helix-helix protein, copG family [Deltaproteobacteria bacterium ADurb.Bin072]|nr:MAG: Ribbon-helix-helix protein, copG family [Deltaproteobacteria bacterium ADurb.Bin072]
MSKMKEQYTVQLEPEFVEKLDKIADDLGISRSQLMRNFLEYAYDDAMMLDKLGMFSTLKFGQKLIKKIKEGLSTGRIFIDKDGEIKTRD